MSEKVLINDVGPRDGLQNQAKTLTPEERLQMIRALAGTGLREIEVGSFVHPKAVPAMANTDQVIAALPNTQNVAFNALIPNRKGYDLAQQTGIKTLNLVTAASNTMNEKNIGMNNAEVMAVCQEVIQQAKKDNVKTMAYIAVSWECPFEGATDPQVVEDTAADLFKAGADRVVIADTIGAADPAGVESLMTRLDKEFTLDNIGAHFHDTRGMGLANVLAAYKVGTRKFDASIGGLGGCPFAPGATGNVATEDVALMFAKMGIETGINLEKLIKAVDVTKELTGSCNGGHSYRWMALQLEKGKPLH